MKQHWHFPVALQSCQVAHAPSIANKFDAISAATLFPCGIDLSHFSEMCSLTFQSPSYISSEEIIFYLETIVDGIHISFYSLVGKELSSTCEYDRNMARFSMKRISFVRLFERRITAFVIEEIASFHHNS
jgi:hypothetical protein